MIGRTFSHYDVVEKLGEGGMGVVYRARDARLDRDVALKVLRPDATADPARRQRLLQEARAASALNHPHIVTVHDADLAPLDGQDVAFVAMECIDGRSLRQVLAERLLGVGEALDCGVQIAEALAVAHHAGLVHRDLKPANVMVDHGGRVKVLDFGLARLVSDVPVDDGTASAGDSTSGEMGTPRAAPAGTAAYMSPEQADARPVDARSDVFSLGIVLYEILAGRRPFRGDSYLSLASAILRETPPPLRGLRPEVPRELERIVARCLAKSPDERYASAGEVLLDLVQCRVRFGARSSGWRAALRRPRYLWPALLAVLGLVSLAAWTWNRSASRRWALEEALPEMDRLLMKGEHYEAYLLARRAQPHLPGNAQLGRFWRDCWIASVSTNPPGAEIFIKSYRAPEREWILIGTSPLERFPMPLGMVRWRITKPGFEPVDAAYAPGGQSRSVSFTLDPEGSRPAGMVRVSGGRFRFRNHPPVELDDFWLDRYEVTNRAFKEFVDQGGYRRKEYWKQPFVKDGRTLDWSEAMGLFLDATGRPGPAGWEMGAYADGEGEYPVSGLSAFEAAAFAAFAGKVLPTFYHWYKATDMGRNFLVADIIGISNFGGKGPVAVGSLGAISPFGTSDMAGNVREWCATRSSRGQYILGGAWNEPAHAYIFEEELSPWSRLPLNGFRCAREMGPGPSRDLPAPVEWAWRNYEKEKPASDEAFRTYRSFFAYDRTPLEAVVDAVEETEHWRRERVSFDAAYGHERVQAHLFLPRNAKPPYQTVVFYPTGAASFHTSSDRIQTIQFDYIIHSGRALLHPIYQGTFERRWPRELGRPNAYRELTVQQVKDFLRSIDYLETRPDIDRERLAVFGISGFFELYVLALDDRLKVGVAHSGGLASSAMPAEIDPINFAPRIRQPLLLLSGRYDAGYPVDLLQKPLLRMLGTPEKDKRHVLVESGHSVMRSAERTRETVDWLDRYLGPAERGIPVESFR